jgi:hypothetical protein
MNILIIADTIGTIGVAITLLAYFLLNINRLTPEGKLYPLLNLFGSAGILYSLFYNWNTPAVMMEVAWMLISFYGTVKAFRFFKP